MIAKSVYDALGAKTYVINNEPNGTNINLNCGSTHIEVLQQYVKEEGLDIAFAYDGDADRCIAVDENGNVDIAKAQPITFDPFNNKYVVLGDVVGNAFTDGKKLM